VRIENKDQRCHTSVAMRVREQSCSLVNYFGELKQYTFRQAVAEGMLDRLRRDGRPRTMDHNMEM